MNRREEILKEEAERFAAFEKMNIYKIAEFGGEDAFSKDPKFLDFEYRYDYRCKTGEFISTFLFFIDVDGKRMIVPFLSVKLFAIKENEKCEYQVKGDDDTMKWWNRTSYQAFHPSI
jgi:hypothetical protein